MSHYPHRLPDEGENNVVDYRDYRLWTVDCGLSPLPLTPSRNGGGFFTVLNGKKRRFKRLK
jgi:hypothetical protein